MDVLEFGNVHVPCVLTEVLIYRFWSGIGPGNGIAISVPVRTAVVRYFFRRLDGGGRRKF